MHRCIHERRILMTEITGTTKFYEVLRALEEDPGSSELLAAYFRERYRDGLYGVSPKGFNKRHELVKRKVSFVVE